MKILFTLSCFLAGSFLFSANAQSNGAWPKIATASDGSTVKMYEWQTESYSGNTLKARAAVSILEKGKSDPVFGVAWFTADLDNNGSSKSVRSIDVNSVKLPGETNQEQVDLIQRTLERQASSWNLSFTNDQLNNTVKLNEEQSNLSRSISNTAPDIIYSNQPSILVSIDGSPKLQINTEWGLETVINSPFTIIKNKDGRFYLYGGKHWYEASSATGPYRFVQQAPSNLLAIESAINDSYKENKTEEEKNDYTISNIIVTTKPTELIQTDGEAQLSAVQGTSLLYVKNTDDDIFMDVSTQNYFVLLSGRWYKSRTLSGNWQFVEADRLPADFARIPDNSEKADVLASVGGTDEARNALEEAQIPQTAKVDRRNATVDVIYDGDPEFESIDGTSLQYATNSPNSVLRYRNRFYAVDNGVWFESYSSRGPWVVAVERPYEVALIAPRYPVYHVKYVYIYDIYDDYVYMGYTPGYLNTYIYGPTVVYGTGFYYRPWHRRYYFPRPCTWGYNMRYSRWYGWGFGVNMNFGWLNIGIGNGYWGYSRRGWWGPSAYRPNFCYRGGYYGYNNRYFGYNNRFVNNTYINYNNNVYNNRRGVSTRDVNRYNDRRRDWASNGNNNRYNDRNGGGYNNGGYNNNRNDNRNRDRNFDNRSYDNRSNNENGGYSNNNRDNRQNNNNNYGNGNNNGNNNGNRGDDIRRRQGSDRPQREYNPQPENRNPGRNGGGNNSGGNENRQREPERRVRENNPPAQQGGNDRNRGGGRFNTENTGGGGNNNNGGSRQVERRENNGGGNNGGGNNGGGRQVERRENNGGSSNNGGGNNNGNGGGRSGRRGG